MENGEWNGVGFGSQYVQIHHLSNGKNQKNRAGNKRAQKKSKQLVAVGDTGNTVMPPLPRVVVKTTGSPWWSLAPLFRRFPNAAFWCFFLVCGLLPWIVRLGLNEPLLQPSLIHLASTSSFSPISWLDICKSEIKNPEQAKTSVMGEIGV